MPNHITNRLIIDGATEEVAKVFDFLQSDTPDSNGYYAPIDFNKIIPMPESLDIASSSEGEDGKKYLLGMSGNSLQVDSYKKTPHYEKMAKLEEEAPHTFKRCIELGKKYLHNISDHGCKTWYEWCNRNWGTKWNAYWIEQIDDNTIMFKTAWSGVPTLIAMLASMFPAVTIKYDYADEDTSYNVGSYIFNGEDIEDNSPANASAEAWNLVFELGVADIEDYIEQPDGTYCYNED